MIKPILVNSNFHDTGICHTTPSYFHFKNEITRANSLAQILKFLRKRYIMANRDINFQKHHSTRQINLRVLLDLDQVLADFEGHFLKEFRKKYPDEPSVELDDREGFWLRDQYDILKPGLGVSYSNF